MGVPGLWDILRPAGKQRSLAQLSVYDGFERNPGGRRGLRVGIDASIWFYHATYGREGENPELRTLFFRCARLMSRPFLPLFVFDGPHRPECKRKMKVSGKDHWLVSGMQEIIEAFGFEWWCAPGEAEAELAYLNRIGIIDAIITDDVDTFLFGANTIIRNPGKMLTGNSAHAVRNTANKDDGEHTYTYSSSDILEHPEINLSQEGMILIALLRGGDYDTDGVDGFGTIVAHALARSGFGETLVNAARNLSQARLEAFLDSWRNEVRTELRSNSRGFLNTRKVKLANTLPDTFPNINVLRLYVHPVTSERKNIRPVFLWDREPDLMKLAALCERKFEWGVREIIIKRFRTVMWAPVVLRIMRRAILDADAAGPSTPKKKHHIRKDTPPGTPSKMITERFSSLSARDEDDAQRLIVGVHGKREHASTDGMPEYRLEIAPAQLVRLTEAGVEGHRVPPSQYRNDSDDEYVGDIVDEDDEEKTTKGKRAGPKKPPPEPSSHLRIWMPACIVERVEPRMVAAYEDRVAQKERDKEEKAARKAARAAGIASPKSKSRNKASPSKATARKAAKRTEHEEEEEEELSADEDFDHVFGLSSKARGKAKAAGAAKSKNGARTKPVPTGCEEEEEEEDDISHSPLRGNSKSKPTPFKEATNSNPVHRPRAKPLPGSSKTQTSTVKSSTNLQRQKTILDLLDERRPIQCVTPSAESVSSPVKPRSQNVRSATLRPFPMSQEDKEDWFRVTTRMPSRTTSTTEKLNSQRSSARRYSAIKSGHDDVRIPDGPKKSPRKSKGHGSPSSRHSNQETAQDIRRNAITITDSEDEGQDYDSETAGRPTSPSPLRPKVTSAARNLTDGVISEASVHEKERRKLVSSEVLSTRSAAPLNSYRAPVPPISQVKVTQAEIIEISSSSESDEKPASIAMRAPKAISRAHSGEAPRRVDSIFQVTKPISSVVRRSLTHKKHARINGTRQPPVHDYDDVIEIL